MSGRSKVLAPVVTVAAVVAVAVTASLVGGSGSTKPKVLRLAGGAGAAQDLAAPASRSSMLAVGDYRLVGSLPAGTPPDAPAWTLAGGAGPADPVTALAKALGAPTPKADRNGWTAGGLHVASEAGRAWWWSPCAVDLPVGPDTAVSSDQPCATFAAGSGVSGTAVTGAGSSGVDLPLPAIAPPPPCPSPTAGAVACRAYEVPPPARPAPLPADPPSEAVALAAARPVLDALGLGDLTPTVTTWPGGGTVQVDPVVGGLPTFGWSTGVDVSATAADQATVSGAHGWLAPASRADSYPLVSAPKAFDRLPSPPRMLLACAAPEPAPDAGPIAGGATPPSCPQPQPQRVTGAHLGLSLTWLADQQAALLPTWLFDVEGSEQPVPSVAVDPTYLDAGGDGSDGRADQTEPGTGTEPAPPYDPGTIEPAPDDYVPPSAEPAGPTHDLALLGWRESTADNAVTVIYDNGGCGQTGVAADVKEDAQHVYVLLHADAPAPDQVCTKDLVEEAYEVALQDPLGARTVVDASTGDEVKQG